MKFYSVNCFCEYKKGCLLYILQKERVSRISVDASIDLQLIFTMGCYEMQSSSGYGSAVNYELMSLPMTLSYH